MTTRSLVERAGTFVGLVLVAIIFGLLVGPQFFAPTNLELMARQMAIVSIAAVGMTIVIVSGGIDLSVGSMIALCTVVIAQLLRMNVSPVFAALGAIATGALCGLVNGVLITQLRVVPFIVTLGTMLIIRGAAKGLGEERRIEAPQTWLNDLLRVTRGETLLPSGIWAVIALSILVALLLRYTRFGRHVFALGSNERMARLCGFTAVLEVVGGRSDSRRRVGAGRHRGGDHWRRQFVWRSRHGCRNVDWRGNHDRHSDRVFPGRARELDTADRHRLHHRRGRGVGSHSIAEWHDMKIRDLEIIDLRFPTSRTADGTDAMHPDPDYSAAYVILKTDGDLEGHGFTF